jgi:hypothetical protein
MTTQEPESTPEKEATYVIDADRVREFQRSPRAIFLSRRCADCQERLEGKWAETPEAAQIKDIVECCSTKEDYIRPDMPMQEIIFREILAAGNKPLRLDHLHYLVTDKWYTPTNPRNISALSLKKVLDSDVHYGFVESAQK